jgi:hypothetical protein
VVSKVIYDYSYSQELLGAESSRHVETCWVLI